MAVVEVTEEDADDRNKRRCIICCGDPGQEPKETRTTPYSVFCPGFQKSREPSEKVTFSAMNGPSKGYN